MLSLQVGLYWVSQMHHISFTYRTYSLKMMLTFFSAFKGEREEALMVCAGREFRLPVYSTSRTVTFTPNVEGQRRVLLDKTIVSGSVSVLGFCCTVYVYVQIP